MLFKQSSKRQEACVLLIWCGITATYYWITNPSLIRSARAARQRLSHCAAINHITWTLGHDMKNAGFYLTLYRTVPAVYAICFSFKKDRKNWSPIFLSLHLIRHGPQRKHRIQQFYCWACIHCRENVFAEQMSSIVRGGGGGANRQQR
jgi:hypothetical protein